MEKADEIYSQAKTIITQKISVESILPIVVKIMTIVEKYKSLSGDEKKQIVIGVITRLVDATDYTSDEKGVLIAFIQTILPTTIDSIIRVANDNLFKGEQRCCF